jgi:hypothetical protein
MFGRLRARISDLRPSIPTGFCGFSYFLHANTWAASLKYAMTASIKSQKMASWELNSLFAYMLQCVRSSLRCSRASKHKSQKRHETPIVGRGENVVHHLSCYASYSFIPLPSLISFYSAHKSRSASSFQRLVHPFSISVPHASPDLCLAFNHLVSYPSCLVFERFHLWTT